MNENGLMDRLLDELDRERASTETLLRRVPEEHLGWRPHARSMSLGELSMHIAGVPSGIANLLTPDEVEVPTVPTPGAMSREEIVNTLEESVREAQKVLAGWGAGHLDGSWQMQINGATIMDAPRYQMVRSLLFNHWYHHRGQLTVYLRMLDVPLPNIYGPTADEKAGG